MSSKPAGGNRLQLSACHDRAGRGNLEEPGGEPERQCPGVVGVNLRDEVRRAGGPSAIGESFDGRPTKTAAAAFRHDRELGDVPAIAVYADQAEPDDLAVHLDEEGNTLGLLPVSVEVGIRLSAAVELEQIVAQQALELLAMFGRGLAERHVHGATVQRYGDDDVGG